MLDLALGERVDGIGKHVEALFHHDPAKEGDDQFVVGDAERPPPCQVAPAGIELLAVDAAVQIEMSRFIRCARSTAAVDSAGATIASQR